MVGPGKEADGLGDSRRGPAVEAIDGATSEVGEVDAPFAVERRVFGTFEGLPHVVVGEDLHFARLEIGARDLRLPLDPDTRTLEERTLAGDEAILRIDHQAIGGFERSR